MFKDIEELEQEIKDFRKNILASKELLRAVEGVVEAVKKQNLDFATAAETLRQTIETHEARNKTLATHLTEDLAEECRKESSALVQIAKNAISDASEQQKKLIEDAVYRFSQTQAGYIDAMERAQAGLEKAKDEYLARLTHVEDNLVYTERQLKANYTAFLERLEKTNVDQIFKTCQEMKKSLELKLWILAGGLGLSIVLTLISIFVK